MFIASLKINLKFISTVGVLIAKFPVKSEPVSRFETNLYKYIPNILIKFMNKNPPQK
jgi:hypothetical protein